MLWKKKVNQQTKKLLKIINITYACDTNCLPSAVFSYCVWAQKMKKRHIPHISIF